MIDKPPGVLRITLSDGTISSFSQGFTVGRHSECALSIQDSGVSRRHADVFWENGQWWIKDLNSANGVFVDGQRIDRVTLFGIGRIQLGAGGPTLFFDVERPAAVPPVYQPPTRTPEATTHKPKIGRAADGERPKLSKARWSLILS